MSTTKSLFSFLFMVLIMFSAPAWANTPQVLDEAALLKNTYERLIATIKEGNPNAKGLEAFSLQNLAIVKKEPITIGNTQLWMVKIGLSNLPQLSAGDSKNIEMDMVVDSSGSYQYSEVMDIQKNKSMFLAARRLMSKQQVPDNLGAMIAQGKGKADVLFISDPFCSFCRKEFFFLKDNMANIGKLKIQHMPLTNITSEIACAFMELSKEKMSTADFFKVVEFAYTELTPEQAPTSPDGTPPSHQILQKLEMATIQQFLQKFPQVKGGQDLESFYYLLKGKYVTIVKNQGDQVKSLFNVTGTPVTVIDGSPVRGFNQAAIKDALGMI